MALTFPRLLLLIPIAFVGAFCASFMDNAVQGSAAMAANAMRPPVRFIGADSLPAPQKTTVHTTVEKPTSHVREPTPQDRTLEMIRAVLALHDLNAETKQAEPPNPMGQSTDVEHDVGSTLLKEAVLPEAHSFVNLPSDQQSILHSVADNDTIVTDPSEVDFPCFGDGYCCCEGCPPGSCPFMSVSIDTGARLPDPLAISTLSCPCAVPGRYCCCRGCPRGTCRGGFC